MAFKDQHSQLARYQEIDDQLFVSQEHEQQEHTRKKASPLVIVTFISIIVIGLITVLSKYSASSLIEVNGSGGDEDRSMFDAGGRFVMRNFDEQKPMSSFLPGLGGIWGVPMWAFYVNRGQGITAFGVDNKDGAIAKYNSAEKAYQQTAFTGFRTFLKGHIGDSTWNHMPFFPKMGPECAAQRDMSIGMNEMEINEIEPSKSIQTNILYFTVPEEEFPALVRKVTITNMDKQNELSLEILDGLTKLEPSGIPNGNLDSMGRTMEAWMNVYNMDDSDTTQPFFHVSQGTADAAQVQVVTQGHFSLAFLEGVYDADGSVVELSMPDDYLDVTDSTHELLPFIVDPTVVFGTDTNLVNPSGFFRADTEDFNKFMHQSQGKTSRTPCAYAGAKVTVPPGGSVVLTSIYGHAETISEFLNDHAPKLRKVGYVRAKRKVATELVESITSRVATNTSSSLFNQYVQQNFLDNVLRGGLPVKLGGDDYKAKALTSEAANRPKIYHVFSRIHGDLERDYNFFNIDTTYFSQGPGNFRDVNQNRRNDVIYSPIVGDFNVRMFLTFVQTDGFNPLTVASTLFSIPASSIDLVYAKLGIREVDKTKWAAMVQRGFRIGQLLKDMKNSGITFSVDRNEFVDIIMSVAVQTAAGQYAQNGFWTDHWTYTLDLVNSFLYIFPDKETEMMYDSEPIPFYMSPAIVNPRDRRYALVDDPHRPGEKTVRVYAAVTAWGELGFPSARIVAMNQIFKDPNFISSKDGAGGVWQRCTSGTVFTVTPITKLAMLAILKFSTLDPLGMGVEMEGGKPGWNDAMNGLPGIIGSEMSETYEMLQIIRYIQKSITRNNREINFPVEFSEFMGKMVDSLDKIDGLYGDEQAEFDHWDRSNHAREKYRSKMIGDVKCETVTWTVDSFSDFLHTIERKTVDGINRALVTNHGLPPTYFFYEAVNYTVTPIPEKDWIRIGDGPPLQKEIVRVKRFKLNSLPLFLEGPTRHLKTLKDADAIQKVYTKVKQSDLYDTALKMFKISGSLVTMRQEIGRMMAFSPGWLENESVWLHMSYKFYLELLRGKLYDAFFLEIATGLVPFMNNDRFGRSPLEAASFIVSSAFPDPKIHGAGFLARLSGSTAEFMSMWTIMTQGHEPFVIDPSSGKVNLHLKPVLARWMFAKDGTLSFTFLGEIKVTYHNPHLLDTWNLSPIGYKIVTSKGEVEKIDGEFTGHEMALLIRELKVESMEVFLG